MTSSRQLSTDNSKEVWIEPGWWKDTSPPYVDMGDGIIATNMVGMFEAVEKTPFVPGVILETGFAHSSAFPEGFPGRRLVAFRFNNRCEIEEIGPPTIVPGDIQVYLDGSYDQDYGDPEEIYFSGFEGVNEVGALVKMSDDVVLAVGLNSLDPVFPFGGPADLSVHHDAVSNNMYACVGWVARLNREDLTWEVGPRGTISSLYFTDPNQVWVGNSGILAEFGCVGAVKMSDDVAVVSLGMQEFGLATSHYDLDGSGDYTDEDVSFDYSGPTIYPAEQYAHYLRLVSLRVDESNLTFSRINVTRVTDRIIEGGAYFLNRCDQPLRLSDDRGIIFYNHPFNQGYYTIWHHDNTGAISSFTSAQHVRDSYYYSDGGQDYSYLNPQTEAEYYAYDLGRAEQYNNMRNNFDGFAHLNYAYGSSSLLGQNLVLTVGNFAIYYHKMLMLYEVNDNDTITLCDKKPLAGKREPEIVSLTDGWVFVSFADYQAQGSPAEPDPGYELFWYAADAVGVTDGSPNMSLLRVDQSSKTFSDYVPLGRGIQHFSQRHADLGGYFQLGGRGMYHQLYDRFTRVGDDHVLLGGMYGITLISPLAQVFPASFQEDHPYYTNATLWSDLWLRDTSTYTQYSGAQNVGSETRIGVYPATGPSSTR